MRLSTVPQECPAALLEKARILPPVDMAIANAVTVPALESARMAMQAQLINPILVGDPARIRQLAETIDWDLANKVRIVPADDEQQAAEAAVALVRNGEAASLAKGHVHTDTLIRAVLHRENGLRTGQRLSHVFHMTVPGDDKPLCISDAVVNIQPGVDDKLNIAQNAVNLLHALGNRQPKVALLSGTEVVSPQMPSSVEAQEIARKAANGAIQGAIVDGPLAFDNAVSQEAAQIKGIDSPVAGAADVLLVPNLEAGNFIFKQMVYFMSATAAGLLLGAKVPIVLTSRADPAEARLASVALASIYSNAQAA